MLPMPSIELGPAERKKLRADAHHLSPVVTIGANGLSPTVEKEVDAALAAHGLVKIRVHEDDRQVRQEILSRLAEALDAAAVQHIGKLLVLWRPRTEPQPEEPDPERRPGPRTVKVVKFSKRGGQRPQVRQVRVLGNERLTPGGKIKKARRAQKSTKKGRGK